VNHPDEEDVAYLNIDKEIRFKFMEKFNDAGCKWVSVDISIEMGEETIKILNRL